MCRLINFKTASYGKFSTSRYRIKPVFTLPNHLGNATEITSPSGLPDRPSSALRQQLHSPPAMRLLSRLEDERSYGANWSTYFVRIPYVSLLLGLLHQRR